MEQYYKELELNSGATEDDIKKSYRRLSKQYHPDMNPGDVESEEKFKKISEAYSVLTGKTKPKEQTRQHSGFTRKGRSMNLEIFIPLEKAYSGGVENITFSVMDKCTPCNGVGGSETQTCNQCGGSGHLRHGHIIFICTNCNGTGELITNVCRSCGGNGSVRTTKTVELLIPKGTTSGTMTVTPGIGNYVKNGVNGDVLFIIHVNRHPIFKLDGMDLKRDVDIPILDVLLGTTLEFETLDGKVKIPIPKLCDPTKTFRLKNKGMVDDETGVSGDLYVTLNPVVPKQLSEEEEAKLSELRNSNNFS